MNVTGEVPSHLDLIRIIGFGGMGLVYEAMDKRLERRVALKVLHRNLTSSRFLRNRLREEARMAARIEHDNVVRVYNIHELDDNLFLEMQFINGVSLAQVIDRDPLPVAHVATFLEQSLRALRACHTKNVVHGDLKPSNFLVTSEGKIYLTDFGIARAAYGIDGAAAPSATASQSLWGTPVYSPPEAWEGEHPTPSWDLYALGILSYEALSKKLPFKAQTPAALMKEKLECGRPDIHSVCPDLSPEFAEIVNDLGSGEVRERPDSAATTLQRLMKTPEYSLPQKEKRPFLNLNLRTTASFPVRHATPRPSLRTTRKRTFWGEGMLFARGALLLCVTAFFSVAAFTMFATPDEAEAPITPAREFVAATGNPGEINDLFVQRGNAFYTYDDGVRGRELWVTDERGRSSLLKDINPGRSSSNPHDFYPRPIGGFMFAAVSPRYGEEPWYCESGSPQARLLKDISVGTMHSMPRPVGAWRDHFFFYAANFPEGNALWVSDSHSNRTAVLHEINPDALAVDSANHAVHPYDEGLFFVSPSGSDKALIHYTYADQRFDELGNVRTGIRDIARLGDLVVFGMTGDDVGYELWMTDFEGKETHLLKDIWPGPQSADPEDFFIWKDEVYFRASTNEFGTELWKTDGTPEGTVQVVDLHEGEGDGSPSKYVAVDDRLYFRGSTYRHGTELWSVSGVPGEPAQVIDTRPGPESSHPYSIQRIGNFLFYSANHEGFGEELWAINLKVAAHLPFLVSDIRPGPESSEPHKLTLIDGNTGICITKTDGADRLVKVIVQDDEITLEPLDPLPLSLPDSEE